MERYESYKDSGVKWIGEIPEHWEVKRLGSFFIERRVKVSDKDYAPLSVTKNGIFPQLENVAKTNDGDNRKLVKRNDFVINSRSDRKGSSGVSPLDGSVSLINIVLKPRNTIYPPYCNYLLKSFAFIEEFYRNGRGIVADLWTTRYDEMKIIKMAMPTLSEQTAIANFLDSVTSKIDEAISQQQKMIDLLNERKQIIIQNAVTKGLDPNAQMKDSGVEWIGEIPEDWKISLIGHLFYIKAGGDAKPKFYSMAKDEIHKYPVYTNCNDSNNVYAYTSIPYFEANTITVTGRGDIGNAFFRKTPYDAIIRLLSLKPRIELDCRFFTFFIDKVIPFTSDSAAVAQLSAMQLKNFVCCFPSKREQSAIADYLDSETSKIDSSISQCNKMISLLQERKQIIINDVVTGKVKVV